MSERWAFIEKERDRGHLQLDKLLQKHVNGIVEEVSNNLSAIILFFESSF